MSGTASKHHRCPAWPQARQAAGCPGHHRQVLPAPHARRLLPTLPGRITIELEIANRDRIVERLRNNEDDLYVMSYPPEDMDIVVHPLSGQRTGGARLGSLGRRTELSLAGLADESFLLRESGSGSRRAIDDFARQAGISLKVRLALASNEALLELAGTGMGLAVLSRHALGDRLAVEGLVVVDVEGFIVRGTWCTCGTRSSGTGAGLPGRCARRRRVTPPDTEDGAATLR